MRIQTRRDCFEFEFEFVYSCEEGFDGHRCSHTQLDRIIVIVVIVLAVVVPVLIIAVVCLCINCSKKKKTKEKQKIPSHLIVQPSNGT